MPLRRMARHQSYWLGQLSANNLTLGVVCNTSSWQWQWADGSAVDFKPTMYNTNLDANCIPRCVWAMMYTGSWGQFCDTNIQSFDISCTKQLEQPGSSQDGCEAYDDETDDVCYQIGPTAENFRNGQMQCLYLGADLASIHDLQENSFIRRLAVSQRAVNGIFFGGTISGKGNDFGWTDGSDWDYENFYPGFPIDGFGNCLALDTQGTSGQWVNVDCNSSLPVACMRSTNVSPSTHVCPSESAKEGYSIYSPGFPYDASTPCDYILSIIMLEANSCCDHLLIYENYFGGEIIANLFGALENQVYTTSSSNFMKVSWQPNGGVNVRGMVMRFRGV